MHGAGGSSAPQRAGGPAGRRGPRHQQAGKSRPHLNKPTLLQPGRHTQMRPACCWARVFCSPTSSVAQQGTRQHKGCSSYGSCKGVPDRECDQGCLFGCRHHMQCLCPQMLGSWPRRRLPPSGSSCSRPTSGWLLSSCKVRWGVVLCALSTSELQLGCNLCLFVSCVPISS